MCSPAANGWTASPRHSSSSRPCCIAILPAASTTSKPTATARCCCKGNSRSCSRTPLLRLEIGATEPAQRRCEVFVIGCGPAGSTIGALLSERGRDVAVVDKERHPRFHIGESLLPLNMPILERLGVWDELVKIGIRKDAAEFESREAGKTVEFQFSTAFDKRWPHA